MKVKALVVVGLLLAGLGAAVALATPGNGNGPPPGKGNPHEATTDTSTVTAAAPASTDAKHPETGPGCKPAVAVVVKGTASGDAKTDSLLLTVSGGNHWAELLFDNNTTTELGVTTDPNTQVTSGGEAAALTSIQNGDNVLAKYKVCKADLEGTNGADAKSLSSFLATLIPQKIVELGEGTEE